MTLWPKRIHRWTLLRRFTALVFLALLVLGSFTWFPHFRGSTSATSLLQIVPFVDPLAALETIIAARHVERDVFFGAACVLAVTVLLGPVFCGWICPLGLLLDLNHTLRQWIARAFRLRPAPPHSAARSRTIRVAVLALLVGFALVSRLPVVQIVSPINRFVRSLVFAPDLGLIVVGAIVLLEYPWPRLWCRSICPLGAVHSLAGRFGLLRVRITRIDEKACWQCSRSCPMGIAVTQDHVLAGKRHVDDPACTRCGACADRCPRDVLRLGFSCSTAGHTVPAS